MPDFSRFPILPVFPRFFQRPQMIYFQRGDPLTAPFFGGGLGGEKGHILAANCFQKLGGQAEPGQRGTGSLTGFDGGFQKQPPIPLHCHQG